eukprot:364159-Chlamydomonas_euryale.AAC.5
MECGRRGIEGVHFESRLPGSTAPGYAMSGMGALPTTSPCFRAGLPPGHALRATAGGDNMALWVNYA